MGQSRVLAVGKARTKIRTGLLKSNVIIFMKKSSFALSALAVLCLISTLGRAQPSNDRGHDPFGSGHFRPIAAWSFDQIDGNSIPDVTGNGFDAVRHEGVTLTTGPQGGQALAFDGAGDNQAWFGNPQVNGLSIAQRLAGSFQEISLEAWICKEPGGWMSIVYRDFWDDPTGFGLVAEWSAGKIMFGHYDPEFGSYVISKTTVQDGSWHHVVGTMHPVKEGFLYRIYVDGTLDAEQVGQWRIEAAAENEGILKIAYPNRSAADHPYCGTLDGIAIYDKALPPGQVNSRYQQSKGKKAHLPD